MGRAACTNTPTIDDGAALNYLLRVEGIEGDSTIDGYAGWFTVDEYTFGVLSQFGAAGGGGGAGKAKFDPLLVDLAGLPDGLVTLLKAAATGQHIPRVELAGVRTSDGSAPVEVYELVLNDVTVAGYAADGDDTALAFNYAKVTQTIREQNESGGIGESETFSFDVSPGSITPVTHDQLAALTHALEDLIL